MRSPGPAAALLVAAMATACASTGATPRPFPRPGDTTPPASATPADSARSAPPVGGYVVAGTALALRGSPYRAGGSDPAGFDCSGLIWYVFARHGVSVPRTVSEQYRLGRAVDPATLQSGDLVFFDTTGSGVSHVGMLIGGDEFVHAPSSQGRVRVERLSSSYWAPRFVGARRVE